MDGTTTEVAAATSVPAVVSESWTDGKDEITVHISPPMPDDMTPEFYDLAKAAAATMPPGSWTAGMETLQQILSPLTATTSGTGRLITEYFERMLGVQKMYSGEVLRKTREKIERSGRRPALEVNARVVIAALEDSSLQADPTLTELWSNLLAQEFTEGGVHPEIPRVLARLTAEDANVLVEVETGRASAALQRARNKVTSQLATTSQGSLHKFLSSRTESLSHSILSGVNLIEKTDGAWGLTVLGEAFIKAVTDPSISAPKPPT